MFFLVAQKSSSLPYIYITFTYSTHLTRTVYIYDLTRTDMSSKLKIVFINNRLFAYPCFRLVSFRFFCFVLCKIYLYV